jgi:hypothetical protein
MKIFLRADGLLYRFEVSSVTMGSLEAGWQLVWFRVKTQTQPYRVRRSGIVSFEFPYQTVFITNEKLIG